MNWTTQGFGKHKGKTIPQIMWADSDWAFWAYEKKALKGYMFQQLRYVCQRASSIRIPPRGGETTFVEYAHDHKRKFAGIYLHTESELKGFERVPCNTSNVIDMGYPHRCSKYDKLGNKILIENVKTILFGDKSYKMSKRRCEEFFEDDGNFVLGEEVDSLDDVPLGWAQDSTAMGILELI